MYNYLNQCVNCGIWYDPLVGHICVMDYRCYKPVENQHNYKCPICNAEFNEPARDLMGPPSHGNPRCPFCSNPMKGLE